MPRRITDSGIESDDECPKKRVASDGNKLPDPIREGEVLMDSNGTSWRLGRSIGIGGFGEIYLASNDINKAVNSDTQYVVKIEPFTNGPLFVERNFYIRTAKPEQISDWCRRRRVKHLGLSQYFGSGSHEYRGVRYRFLVLQRFGQDLGKLFVHHRRRFHIKTVLYLGIQILDALEYIHSHGYVHVDIKASNLVLGRAAEARGRVHLVDFGLACKFRERNGAHKEYRPDLRKAHTGTLEYTSRDAHVGALSRRGDLETLGYNMVQWLCGHLPWEERLPDGEAVLQQKQLLMANVPSLMRRCFPGGQHPDVISRYLRYVAALDFETQPDYTYCRKLLRAGVTEAGFVDDRKLEFGTSAPLLKPPCKYKGKRKRQSDEPENIAELKPKKIVRTTPRQPCVAHNLNRTTRNSPHVAIVLRSHLQFNWEKVLSSHPERPVKKTSRPQMHARVEVASPPRSTPSPVPSPDDPGLPTPAMLTVLARQRERSLVVAAAARKSRSDSSRSSRSGSPVPESTCNLPSHFAALGPLTYAMEDVLRRREQRWDSQYEGETDGDIIRVTRSGPKRRAPRRCSPRLNTILNATVGNSAAVHFTGEKKKAVVSGIKKTYHACSLSFCTRVLRKNTLRG